MEIIIRRRDMYVVAVVLSLFFSWVAWATFENHDARERLRALASQHVDEWFATEPEGTRREDYEYLALVDSVRPYTYFGPTFGVVHVYIRDKGDVECKTFKGIEYYYRLEDDAWKLEHSAGCSAKSHHIRAFEQYVADGSDVKDFVFDQALGIDFDVAKAEEHIRSRSGDQNPFMHDHADDHGHEHGAGVVHDHGDGHGASPATQGAPAVPRRDSAQAAQERERFLERRYGHLDTPDYHHEQPEGTVLQ